MQRLLSQTINFSKQSYFSSCFPMSFGYIINKKHSTRHYSYGLKLQSHQASTKLKVTFPYFSTQNCCSTYGGNKSTLLEKLICSFPPSSQPYLKLMRIDKPTGTLLLLWPCYWSLAMASTPGSFPDVTFLALFGCGAFLMRGAGCTINDLWDKDLDSKVSRTMHRPLASGELSILDALMFLGAQLSLALFILLQLNWYSIVLGSTSLFPVTFYPLMKRITYYPQFVLGLTFNWGALLGWSAVNGSCEWSIVLPLYCACVFWTMIYDTIYAHQDRVDDVLIKIKSTALKFGEETKLWLSSFAAISTTCFLISGYNAAQTWPYYMSVGLTAYVFYSQILSLNIHSPDDCYEKFKSNQWIGWIIFFGITAGTFFKSCRNQLTKSNDLRSNCLDTSAYSFSLS